MAGKRAGAPGAGQWPGAGAATLNCSPRKFSEKIALHTQRQAEDIAAFEEVMMDITSTRLQAQRVRQVRSLASYYGGSLPNVSQMSKYSTETQRQFLCNTDNSCPTQHHHLRTDPGQRNRLHNHPGRPNRRHTDSAPYLSFHLSPPSGPSWRSHTQKNWSNRSANEKSQVDLLPVATLSRTNSDSALHTSGRMTCSGQPSPSRVFTACSRQTVPLIEESVQEEMKLLKPQKISSEMPLGDTSGTHISPSPDLSCSIHSIPSLSMSGSLPDLSTLHLPSTVSTPVEAESQSCSSSFSTTTTTTTNVHQLSNTPATSATLTDSDCPLPNLPFALQASTSNPLLQSSLSNPNLQTTLSSHSLPNSLSSTSLCLSLSNSSLQSSLSNQSLQSSLSSSSLSNQSVHSAASHCSYSSGIGVSRSCSSSSLSCSPHASRQVAVPHAVSSRKRTKLNPLMVPSGGESLGQQAKQFSPTMPSALLSVNQGVSRDSSKVHHESKLPSYRFNQLPPTGHQLMAHPSVQHYKPEAWDPSKQDTRQHFQQQALQPMSSQPQHLHNKAPQQHLNPHHYTLQHPPEQNQNLQHQYTQAEYHRQVQQAQQFPQTHQYASHQSQQHYLHKDSAQPLQHQQYLEPNQCWDPQSQFVDYNQNQHYRCRQERSNQAEQTLMLAEEQNICWQNPTNQPSMDAVAVKKSHMNEPTKMQPKIPFSDSRSKRAAHYPKLPLPHKDQLQPKAITSLCSTEKEFQLHSDSYTGLHLTPSQTEALSQKLGLLHKEPPDDSKCQPDEGKEVPGGETFVPQQAQCHNSEMLHDFPSINFTVPSSWLDDEISDLPVLVPDFDLEPFILGE